jgi:transcriptional regulator with XRE-family HTH domain
MRAGYSQAELAYLLGLMTSSTISRYEQFVQEPSLENALACEVIFGVPVRELFAGMFENVREKTTERVDRMGAKLSAKKQDRYTQHKIQSLLEALRRCNESDNDEHA